MPPKLAPLAPIGGAKPGGLAPLGAAAAVSKDKAQEVFDRLDLEKKGKLTKDDLRQGLWKMTNADGEGASADQLGAADRYIDQLFARADANLSGSLSINEFQSIAEEVMRYMGPARS